MTTSTTKPAKVFSLTEFVSDELVARGWTTAHLAWHAGHRDPDSLAMAHFKFDLLLGLRPEEEDLITDDEMFADIARAFGVSEAMLRNIEALWHAHPDRRSPFEAPDSVFAEEGRSFYRMPDLTEPKK